MKESLSHLLNDLLSAILFLAAHRRCRPTGHETVRDRCPGERLDPPTGHSYRRELDPGFPPGKRLILSAGTSQLVCF